MNPATANEKQRIPGIHVLGKLHLRICGICQLSNLEWGNLVYLDFSIAALDFAWRYS